ncbi:MAG: S1-like domain-containing RNA-binding protein [Reinekea sp.]|nr:S1-like domain-containing RNA-binding protein [Reinekea sp.]
MAQIGKHNTLEVVSKMDFGVYLDGENLDTILLPSKQCPEKVEIGDFINVFIYLDSEDRLIATRLKPYVEVGQCAALTVKEVTSFGAFLDWGLPKDLLVPFNQQRKPMEVGERHVVYLYVDEHTQRITGSAKLSNFLREETSNYEKNDRVDLMIVKRTNLGYQAIVDSLYLGMIFNEDVLKPMKPGQRIQGYIKQIREDNKIDLSIQLQGHEARVDIADRILDELARNNGLLNLSDKSSPDDIYDMFQVSKGNFKKAIGRLLKLKKIQLESDRIVSVSDSEQ